MNNKNWNVDLVGVLADPDYVMNTLEKQAFYINSQNIIQFYVKLISEPPYSFPNVKLITCYATDLEKWGFEDNYNAHPIDRIQLFRDFLQDNLIVFKPNRKVIFDHTEVFVGRDIKLLPKSESFHEAVTLKALPVFSEEEHDMGYSDFITKLKNRKYVGRIDNISSEANDTPEYVVWRNQDDQYVVIGEFESHHYAHGGYNFQSRDQIKIGAFKDQWIDDCYEYENVLFVTLDIYSQLSEVIEEVEVNVHEEEIVREVITKAHEEVASTVVDKITILQDEIPAAISKKQEEIENEKLSEKSFCEDFIHLTKEQGLLYDVKDLYNFHTAMKSSNLIILAGMSGTGKSKLVQVYSKALGLFDENQLTFIPVRPGWTDDSDLIGYADTLHMVYRPGDSGLVNTLMSAKDNKKKLHVICFDEMNLARVEHYFSQFLSVLEIESGPRRVLRLYNENLENRLYNSAQYPPTIPIGDNVIFVGTVNLDESTYHFSDKVLDRANVISLNVMPFTNLRNITEEMKLSLEEKRSPMKRETISYEQYDHFRSSNNEIELSDAELSILWEIHTELQKVNQNLGAGPRIVRQIDLYMKNLVLNSPLERAEAFDLQIVQRILTKVRGPEDQLKPFVGQYDMHDVNVSNSKFKEILDKYSIVSEFQHARETIIHKAKELKIHGYTI